MENSFRKLLANGVTEQINVMNSFHC